MKTIKRIYLFPASAIFICLGILLMVTFALPKAFKIGKEQGIDSMTIYIHSIVNKYYPPKWFEYLVASFIYAEIILHYA